MRVRAESGPFSTPLRGASITLCAMRTASLVLLLSGAVAAGLCGQNRAAGKPGAERPTDRAAPAQEKVELRPRVEVIGQTTRPHVRWRKNLTLLDVVLLAGGGGGADLQNVCVLRVQPTATAIHEVDVRAMLLQGETARNIQLQPWDLVVVPAEPSEDEREPAATDDVPAALQRIVNRDRRLASELATAADRDVEAAIRVRLQGWRMLLAKDAREQQRRIVELGRLGEAAAPAVPHLIETPAQQPTRRGRSRDGPRPHRRRRRAGPRGPRPTPGPRRPRRPRPRHGRSPSDPPRQPLRAAVRYLVRSGIRAA